MGDWGCALSDMWDVYKNRKILIVLLYNLTLYPVFYQGLCWENTSTKSIALMQNIVFKFAMN